MLHLEAGDERADAGTSRRTVAGSGVVIAAVADRCPQRRGRSERVERAARTLHRRRRHPLLSRRDDKTAISISVDFTVCLRYGSNDLCMQQSNSK